MRPVGVLETVPRACADHLRFILPLLGMELRWNEALKNQPYCSRYTFPSTKTSTLARSGLTPDERTISAYATAASPIVACSYSVGLR
jgi:hypothetical protein